MDWYANGLIYSFLIQLYLLVSLVFKINSRLNKNLKKIGMRVSWISTELSPIETHGFYYKTLRIFLIFISYLVGIFLSWFSVIVFMGNIIYVIYKNIGMPSRIKEARWKLKNMDMEKDDVIRAIFDIQLLPEPNFEKFRKNFYTV